MPQYKLPGAVFRIAETLRQQRREPIHFAESAKRAELIVDGEIQFDAVGFFRPANGAIDNASGVAALTEVARALAKGPPLERDVYFLSTTGEEVGLLGAHAFAENPPVPLDGIVAAFNIDSVAIAPAGTPFAIVGKGMTGLDEDIAKVARRAHFDLLDSEDANEFVRRQDGWALLQHDIPAVMVTTAYGDISRMRAFYESDYHRPSDDLTHGLELGGEVEDVLLLTDLGRWFSDPRNAPLVRGEAP